MDGKNTFGEIMEQHFVEFYSPGTFFSEITTQEIASWDADKAVEMSKAITERHNAKPFGFRFITRGRADNELDSKVIAKSGMYYLGGDILTIADVESRNDPSDKILLQNMKGNGIDRVIVNTNSWRVTMPFNDDDVLLDV